MTTNAAVRPDAGLVHDETSLGEFVSELEDTLHDLSRRTALCWWDKYTGGPGQDLDRLEKERSQILLDPASQDVVRTWTQSPASRRDPVLGRKVEVLSRSMIEARVSSVPEVYTLQNRIMDRVVSYRPVIFGREVTNAERNRILRQETDRNLRREAWMSLAPLSMEVSADTVELLRRRNDLARANGFPTYADLVLSLSSLSRSEVNGLVDDLEAASAEPFRDFVERTAETEGLGRVELWDLNYLLEKATAIPAAPFPREKILPALDAFLQSFGRDPASLGIRIVTQDIPFGGLCIPVDPPSDVRVLANPQDGHSYYATLFHEYGHALHAVFAGANSYLLQDEPSVFCEGMAEVWSWFTYYPAWLGGLGLDAGSIEAVSRAHGLRSMLRHRQLAAQAIWEWRAYDDPGQDLTALASSLEARYLLAPARPVHRWAGSPFPSGFPVYRQNYILSDLIAAATHQALHEDYGDQVIGNPEAFARLGRTYWGPGAARQWRDKLAEFTGSELAATYPVYG